MDMKYTAQEMREMAIEAEVIEVADQCYGHDMDTIAAMLRQAADMIEWLYESDVDKCRRCQTARSGAGFGDVPTPIGDDDICDRCEIAKRIRGYEEARNEEVHGTGY